MDAEPRADDAGRLAERAHWVVLVVLQLAMSAEVVALIWRKLWMNAAIAALVMVLTLSPLILRRRLPVRVPYAFQFFVVIFLFASLFLGEIRRFYDRFWWWDIALHFSSGLLLGMLGFMLIYILNQNERVHLSVKPGFMALFAFCFALALGGLWEIVEFSVDEFFGGNMQKAMLGDASGLTDTMFDLIVDALGGLIVSLYGYAYMRRGEPSLVSGWIERTARENPRRFGRPPRRGRS